MNPKINKPQRKSDKKPPAKGNLSRAHIDTSEIAPLNEDFFHRAVRNAFYRPSNDGARHHWKIFT